MKDIKGERQFMKRFISVILTVLFVCALAVPGAAESVKKGDTNGDGNIDNKDVVTLFRFVSGSGVSCVEAACDINGDGYIDNKDVVVLFRYLSGGQMPGGDDAGELPEADLKGREVVVIVNGDAARDDILSTEEPGDRIRAAIRERKNKAEKAGNFKLECVTSANAAAEIRKSYLSAAYDFDLTMLTAEDICSLAAQGSLADLNKVPQLQLDGEGWDNDAVSAFTVEDKLFCATGDVSVSTLDKTYLIAFNKQMLEKSGDGMPYDAVRYGNFTIDYLYAKTYELYSDENGNGAVDDQDSFALGASAGSAVSLLFGFGGKLTETDGNGKPYPYISDRTVNAAGKLGDIFNYGKVLFNDNETVRGAFTDGRVAFFLTNAEELCGLVKDTKFDIGVLPLPKSDEAQESYCSAASQDALLFAVPYNRKTEPAGAALELLCRISTETVLPVYLDSVAQTADDLEMFDLIFRERRWDLLFHGLYTSIDEELMEAAENDTLEMFAVTSQIKASQAISNYVDGIEKKAQ